MTIHNLIGFVAGVICGVLIYSVFNSNSESLIKNTKSYTGKVVYEKHFDPDFLAKAVYDVEECYLYVIVDTANIENLENFKMVYSKTDVLDTGIVVNVEYSDKTMFSGSGEEFIGGQLQNVKVEAKKLTKFKVIE